MTLTQWERKFLDTFDNENGASRTFEDWDERMSIIERLVNLGYLEYDDKHSGSTYSRFVLTPKGLRYLQKSKQTYSVSPWRLS